MKRVFLVGLLQPLLLAAQTGVHFETSLTWQQIRQKAKIENKYILVDCFTSRYPPCKRMDNEVYSNDSVAATVNNRLICVKVQLDTSKNDNDNVKAWYPDAHWMASKYKIGAYPTFLFSPPTESRSTKK